MFLSLEDYAYLNQRLYLPQHKLPTNAIHILSVQKEIHIHRSNLNELLQMVVLKGDYWYSRIESFIGNPLEPPSLDGERCGNANLMSIIPTLFLKDLRQT